MIWELPHDIPENLIVLRTWHGNSISYKHKHEFVQDFLWFYDNPHTLYSNTAYDILRREINCNVH